MLIKATFAKFTVIGLALIFGETASAKLTRSQIVCNFGPTNVLEADLDGSWGSIDAKARSPINTNVSFKFVKGFSRETKREEDNLTQFDVLQNERFGIWALTLRDKGFASIQVYAKPSTITRKPVQGKQNHREVTFQAAVHLLGKDVAANHRFDSEDVFCTIVESDN